MSDGISPNKLNDLSKVYLDQINTFREIRKQETAQDIERWSQPAKDALQQEAKVDTGSAEAKASARNVRNTPPGKDSKFDTSVFITRKPGESLDSARTRKRREAHAKKRGMKEDRALDIVRASIIKKHGEGAIYDAKRDKPTDAQKKAAAAERQKRQAEKNKAFADRAKKAGYKSTQDYANVVARYGSEDNMKKGTGLGS